MDEHEPTPTEIAAAAAAASTGDNTEVDCDWVRRVDVTDGAEAGMFMSAKLVITYTAALGADDTLSFGVQFQDATSAAGAGDEDYGDAVAKTVVATGDSGGSTETGTVEIDIDLSGAREYVRSQITPDLSAGSADTAEWSAVLVLFGPSRQPTTLAIASVGGL